MAVLPSVDLSQAMLTVEQLLRRIAGFDSPLLITGEYPYSQPPGLQLRGPRDPRHGNGRAYQLLRGCGTGRHYFFRQCKLSGEPDQLLPCPLGAQHARHLAREEAGHAVGRGTRILQPA